MDSCSKKLTMNLNSLFACACKTLELACCPTLTFTYPLWGPLEALSLHIRLVGSWGSAFSTTHCTNSSLLDILTYTPSLISSYECPRFTPFMVSTVCPDTVPFSGRNYKKENNTLPEIMITDYEHQLLAKNYRKISYYNQATISSIILHYILAKEARRQIKEVTQS